jgi:carbon storage regulator
MLIQEATDMLILTRRPREVVMVGRDVQIMVLDIAGDRVRLGITAPRELKVVRHETKPAPAPPTQP